MHFKFPISQFKIVSSASEDAIFLFQYAILHRKSTIRQFKYTIRQFKRAICRQNHAILHFETIVLQFKHSTLQFKPAILPFQHILIGSVLLFDYGDFRSFIWSPCSLLQIFEPLFQTFNNSMRTWYLALVISNTQSFDSNIQTFKANTLSLVVNWNWLAI